MKTTHISLVRAQILSIKQAICSLIGWTEEQYAEFQFKTGCQYLQAYIPQCPAEIDQLIQSKEFWNWFKNHWLHRDKIFLSDPDVLSGKISQFMLQYMYEVFHHHDDLASSIKPRGILLSDSFSQMIGKFNDQINQAI